MQFVDTGEYCPGSGSVMNTARDQVQDGMDSFDGNSARTATAQLAFCHYDRNSSVRTLDDLDLIALFNR